jgi:hypothetical protein
MSKLDFNTAGEQYSVVPAGTICTLHMTIRPGGVGDDGWLKKSADGGSEGLDCEFTITAGEHAKRKFWQIFTLQGTTEGHAEAGKISRKTLRAILESARGIRPDDKSEAAQAARKLDSWGDLDQLRFIAKLGVRPASGNYPAKNTILEVVTPERQDWKKLDQIPRGPASRGPEKSEAPPANAIVRPQWGQAKS